ENSDDTRTMSEAIHDRFDRIYEELGVIEASGNPAFAKHEDKPLLTSVVGFGQTIHLMTKEPTDDVTAIKAAVAAIERDDSGIEKVFSSIYMAVDRFKHYRIRSPVTNLPERNVMIVAFTDERGDDQEGLEDTTKICRRYAVPVYVVGVPAPFGREETLVKWVDPDPEYDQTPGWGEVNQGPESLLPERIKLTFASPADDLDPMDSGFGPFALTRLCYETGGIYFAVHPNRNVNREISRNETAAFSSHLKYFFDPQVMRRYRPDYVSLEEYLRRAQANRARAALLTAAKKSWVSSMAEPKLRFVKRSEAELANRLTEAQKAAAKLDPLLLDLYETLRAGEEDRTRETSPRWQAGYDLAMGRVMATMVRTQAYNAMLAQAKRGMPFRDGGNNTWVLVPSSDISIDSRLSKAAEKATEYLQRVIDEHPDTPWALLARCEMDSPIGWSWSEEFTDLTPRSAGGGGNNGNPRDDVHRNVERGPVKRPVPKL
ncbi:MAG: VWA domain-containing protein, partial [Planctomycetes bacterium]|nr:VWA domain-containing protein [Planctomycetota bacterium]